MPLPCGGKTGATASLHRLSSANVQAQATLEPEGSGTDRPLHCPVAALHICGVPPTSGDPVPPLQPAKKKKKKICGAS